MARSYFKLLLSTWHPTSDFPGLTIDAQWLYWVLGSHPLLSPAGVLPIQERKWSRRASNATPDTVSNALAELVDKGLILIDADTEEALIRTFIRHDGGARNTNIGKAIAAAIDRIESHHLRAVARAEFDHAVNGTSPQEADPDEPPPVDPDEHPTERSDSRSEQTLGKQTSTPTPTPTPSSFNLPPSTSTARDGHRPQHDPTDPIPISHATRQAISKRGQ